MMRIRPRYPWFHSIDDFGDWYKHGGKELCDFHHYILSAKLVAPYTLHTVFDDGKEVLYHIFDTTAELVAQGVLDKSELDELEPLHDPEFFAKMHIRRIGIEWYDKKGQPLEVGERYVDLCLEYIYYYGQEICPPHKK